MITTYREDDLEKIISLETQMLQELNAEEPVPENTLPAFQRMRWMTYSVLSDATLALWRRDIVEAKRAGRNVLAEKYAMIGGQIPMPDSHICCCCTEFSGHTEEKREKLCNNPKIEKIVEIESRWQQLVSESHPKSIQRKEETEKLFKKYAVCELYTWSEEAVDSYLHDVERALTQQRNLAQERYDNLYASIGKGSLDEVEKSM